MRKALRTTKLTMTLAAIVGLAAPALGEDWRPFSGNANETLAAAETVADACLQSCQVTAVGTGHATYLGAFTRLSCVVVNPDGTADGVTEFIAANGDKLCATVNAEPPDADSRVRGTYTFTGGTGRFSDASGGAYFVGTITFDDSGNVHIAVEFGGIIQK
jgi:hypothetical protein